MSYGEYWAYRTVKAVLDSPAWPRTLLIYTYDEHGGYYDHVPPPAAIAPDSIPPELGPGDVPGGYDIYGPRVPGDRRVSRTPSRTASPTWCTTTPRCSRRSRPSGTCRRSPTATRTRRPSMDFLDLSQAAFLEPPASSSRTARVRGRRRWLTPMKARRAVRRRCGTARPAPAASRWCRAAARRRRAAAAAFKLPQVRHVFVIVLENQNYDSTFGDPAADPYLAQHAARAGRAARRTTTPPGTRATTTTSRSSPVSRRTRRTRPTARCFDDFVGAD